VSDIVENYIKGGSGAWLKTTNCAVGATVTIGDIWVDDESFKDEDGNPRKYLCIGGTYDLSGEDCQVRLSKTNARRIAETLGDKAEQWKGAQIKCVLHMDYPGVSSRGLVWDGVKPEAEQKKLKK